MMVSMETYLRRGQRRLQRLVMVPKVRTTGMGLLCWASGFFLSGASLMGFCLPLDMSLIIAVTGWQATAITLGAIAGYPAFFGLAGFQGMIWSAVGGVLAVMVSDGEARREQPFMLPAIAAFLTAVTGLVARIFLQDSTPVVILLLRTGAALFSAMLFAQAVHCRDAVTDWLVGGVGVFALAQAAPVLWLNLGHTAAGLLAVAGAFPGAALAGLGLDLAQVTKVPMTAVMSLAYFIRLLPIRKRCQSKAEPRFS